MVQTRQCNPGTSTALLGLQKLNKVFPKPATIFFPPFSSSSDYYFTHLAKFESWLFCFISIFSRSVPLTPWWREITQLSTSVQSMSKELHMNRWYQTSKALIPRTSSENLISYWWLKEIYSQLPYHYRKNLKGLGIYFWEQGPLGTWVHSDVQKSVLHCQSCVMSCLSCIANEETKQIKNNCNVGQLKMAWRHLKRNWEENED